MLGTINALETLKIQRVTPETLFTLVADQVLVPPDNFAIATVSKDSQTETPVSAVISVTIFGKHVVNNVFVSGCTTSELSMEIICRLSFGDGCVKPEHV